MNYSERAVEYCNSVLNGSIGACKWVKASCQRHLDDLETALNSESLFYFDTKEAERVCAFVELMPHIKGEWARARQKLKLEPWQIFILASLFGWKRSADKRRRFRTAYFEVSRKNAKSTLLSAIALYLLALDGEPGAEIYSAATKKDQAKIVFETAKKMADREPAFRDAFGVECSKNSVFVEDSASKFEALSSDADTLDGLNVHGGIIDELHAHKTRDVWDVIETATGSRSQPLVVAITTAGSNRAGICYEIRSYLCTVLNHTLHKHDGLGYRIEGDSTEDDTFFGAIYTIDDADDWTDETVWSKANPNLSVSVYLDDLRRKARKAMQMASAQPNFLTKHLNKWVNADSSWMDMRAWDARGNRKLDPAEYAGYPCWVAMDLSSKLDITALTLLFRVEQKYKLFTKFFLPEDTVDDSDNSQYKGWAIDGTLTTTEGNVIDYDAVAETVRDWYTRFNPESIGFDQGFGFDFVQRLSNEGLPMVAVPNNVGQYSEPMKELEKLTLSIGLEHDGNAAMAWMMSNVVCHRDAKDQIYPRKEQFNNKIDGPVSAIIAFNLAMRDVDPGSVYDDRGVIFA
jgi:phage terminase large subunit-like protein